MQQSGHVLIEFIKELYRRSRGRGCFNYELFFLHSAIRESYEWKLMWEFECFRYGADLLPIASGGEPETREFLNQMTEILMDYLHNSFDRSEKILDFHHPEQLLEILDLTLPNQPQNIEQLMNDCRDILKYQVKTGI